MMSPTDQAMAWREALAAMRSTGEPCPGISARFWPVIHAQALTFLDTHGARLVELGWTVEDLFGVHPEFGALRFGHVGVLMMGAGQPIDGFDVDRIWRGSVNYPRAMPDRQDAVPIWHFRA